MSQFQVYQTFWRDYLTPDVLVADWDVFINHFKEYLIKNVSIEINQRQVEYLKYVIDPQNRNEVYKSSYLMFIKHFWSIPSNRTKFFKSQLNLNANKIPRLKFIFTLPNNKILLKLRYLNDQKQLISKVFQLKNDKILIFNQQNEVIHQQQVKNLSFLTFGNSQSNDICINDCKYINKTHFKLIQIKTKKKIKQNMFQMQNQQKYQQQTVWYLKDVSKSNRTRYCLNNQFKYVVLRQGMIIHFGLTNEYILQVNEATSSKIQQKDLKQIQQLFDNERINYLGQIDPKIPEKTIFQVKNQNITANDIETMYFKQQLYPETEPIVNKKTTQLNLQEQTPIKLTLFNQLTLEKKQYSFINGKISVGRNKKSSIRIDLSQIRQIQCQIQCIGGIWLLKNVQNNFRNKYQLKLQQNTLSVSLANKFQIQQLKNSGKSKLPENTQNLIKGKNFCVAIKIVNEQKREQN